MNLLMVIKKQKTLISQIFWITLGAFLYAVTYTYLILPARLGEGGAMGVTTILYYTLNIPPYLSNLVINGILVVIGWRFLDHKTAILTIYAVAVMTLFLRMPVFYHYHTVQTIIPTVLAGFITGISMGMIMRAGGTVAGDTIIGRIANRYLGVSTGTAMLTFDLAIAIPSVFIIGFQNMLLTVIYLYLCAIFTNQYMDRVGARKAIFIISPKYHEIAGELSNKLHQGITVLSAQGFYSGRDETLLYLICTSKQLAQIVPIVEKNDAKAVIVVDQVRSVRGLEIHRLL